THVISGTTPWTISDILHVQRQPPSLTHSTGRDKEKALQQKSLQSLIFTQSGRRDLNPRPPEPHSGALPDCATSRKTRRQGAETQRRRGKASPPDPTPSPKDSRCKTSPLISHIHSVSRHLGVYLHVSASGPSKPSAACTGRAVPDRLHA